MNEAEFEQQLINDINEYWRPIPVKNSEDRIRYYYVPGSIHFLYPGKIVIKPIYHKGNNQHWYFQGGNFEYGPFTSENTAKEVCNLYGEYILEARDKREEFLKAYQGALDTSYAQQKILSAVGKGEPIIRQEILQNWVDDIVPVKE